MLHFSKYINKSYQNKTPLNTLILLASGFFPAFLLFFLSSGLWKPANESVVTEFILLLVVHNLVVMVAKMGLDNINFAKSKKNQEIFFYINNKLRLRSFIFCFGLYLVYFLSLQEFNFLNYLLITLASFLDSLAIITVSGLHARMAIKSATIVTLSSYGTLSLMLLVISMFSIKINLSTLIVLFCIGNFVKFILSIILSNLEIKRRKISEFQIIKTDTLKVVVQQAMNYLIYKFDQLLLLFFSMNLSPSGISKFIFFAKTNEILVGISIALTPIIYEKLSFKISKIGNIIPLILIIITFTFLFISVAKLITGIDLPLLLTIIFSSLPAFTLIVNNMNIKLLGSNEVNELLKIELILLLIIVPLVFLLFDSLNNYSIFVLSPTIIMFYSLLFFIFKKHKI